jgi:flagellin-like hook-associated protein FlgL
VTTAGPQRRTLTDDPKEITMRYLPLFAVSLALVACSGSDDDGSSFCDDREELQSSFQDLRDVNVADDGIEALDAAIDDVIADLTTLRASATDFQPQVDGVESALEALQTAVDAADAPGEKVIAAVDGLSNVSVAWQALEDAGADCD